MARLEVIRGGAENLLTVREVATRLGVATAMVYSLVDRGELVHIRLGNAIRVHPADLVSFIDTGKQRRR